MKFLSILLLAVNLGFAVNAQAAQCVIISITCDPVGPDGRVHGATIEHSGSCSRDQRKLAANDYCNCGNLVSNFNINDPLAGQKDIAGSSVIKPSNSKCRK